MKAISKLENEQKTLLKLNEKKIALKLKTKQEFQRKSSLSFEKFNDFINKNKKF